MTLSIHTLVKTIFIALLLFSTKELNAQKNDTLKITSAHLNTKVLREGTHRYLVYFKMAKDSVRTETQFWTRTIQRVEYKGTPALKIQQEWEDKDSIIHIVTSYSDAKTMRPLYHNSWWKVQTSRTTSAKTVNLTTVDFLGKTVVHNGSLLSDTVTGNRALAIWKGFQSATDHYFLNWHLDLETFPLLPYRKGVTFLIPYYDPGTASNLQQVAYTVTGSAQLMAYDDEKIDCWLLVHESKGNKEVFWISKKTKEVLKLEQEINGRMFRYKIKLGFSM